MKYNPKIVIAFFVQCGLPKPEIEYRFHPDRKWRFDFAWPEQRVYLEVQGGIWISGGHSRGAGMKRDWEKFNAATVLGWRPIFVEPKLLATQDLVGIIGTALTTGCSRKDSPPPATAG
jgi:hypothetical protein